MSAPWEDPRVVAGLDRQMVVRGEQLAWGATHVGWKVGFGAPAGLELMQISAPLLGFMTDRTVLAEGSSVDVSTWQRGVVEFEVAVYMGSDLGPHATEAQARAAVSALGPSLELADVHLPVSADGVEDILASNIFHRGVILGGRDSGRAGLKLDGLLARIFVDGDEYATTTELEAITGRYPQVVATVASTLAANGERLLAGDVIITGSVIPPVAVSEGSVFSFALDPFDPISVHLTGSEPLQ